MPDLVIPALIPEPYPCYAGDPMRITLTVAGVDLTDGWSDWSAQWRTHESADDVLPFTVDDSDAANGVLILTMSGADVRSMGRGGVFDVQAKRPDNEVVTWWRGRTDWRLDVTR